MAKISTIQLYRATSEPSSATTLQPGEPLFVNLSGPDKLYIGATDSTSLPTKWFQTTDATIEGQKITTQNFKTQVVEESPTNKNIYLVGTDKTANKLYTVTKGNVGSEVGIYVNSTTGVLHGAAWNDFAELRKCNAEPGTVVCEMGDGSLQASTHRLQPGASVVSDTYGVLIGPRQDDSRPICVAGRVLVHLDSTEAVFPGSAVCAGPNGKASIMTREEIKEYPDRILGYISEVPAEDEWNGVPINGRVWIRVK